MNLKALKKIGSEILETAVIVVVFFYVLFPVSVNGSSMMPTLHNKDRIFMSRIMAVLDKCATGDIVVIKLDINDRKTGIVKRIAAVAGDSIEIKDEKLYINNIEKRGYAFKAGTEDKKYVIEKGYVYVLGDDAQESTDSRDFGPVKTKDIEGKAVMIFFPFDRLTFFK